MKINIETSIILLVFIQLQNIFVHANPINKAGLESAIVQDGEIKLKKLVPSLKKESSLLANDEKLIETLTSGGIGQRQHVLRKRGEVHPYKGRDRFVHVIAEVDPDELEPNIFGLDSDDQDIDILLPPTPFADDEYQDIDVLLPPTPFADDEYQDIDVLLPPAPFADLVASSNDDDAVSSDDESRSVEIPVESDTDDSVSGDLSDDESENITIDERVGDERNEK
ncbi:hypothetical protein PV328_011457 [Microctonus aethiopoides]|uniref:Uncharacterized protein n=1 Tax=Microctonus aethiopoides TaxID=144406 RepID=A0AA39C533_9HYME|nr:hypothetical protein PV328_011457 [Microctonus aethiopoides]